MYENEDFEEIENCELSEEKEHYYSLYYADFLNRLAHEQFIAYTSVQDIANEFLKTSLKSQEWRKNKLRKKISENLLSPDMLEDILGVLDEDVVLKAQLALNSQYKRNKFIHENFNFTAPIEVLLNKDEVQLGAKKDVFHYVPLHAALRSLLEDETFISMMNKSDNRNQLNDRISDIYDGLHYKNNEFFQRNPDAFALIFYSDGVELKNPLGSARGTYKVVQVFYTLANIPKHQRSQVDKLHLCMVFRESLLKKYSYRIIYHKLISDLRKLEEEGLVVYKPEVKTVKFGLILYAADNLEAHQLGGFSGSFSSKSICRHCHCQYDDLEDHIHDHDSENSHERWTVQQYNSIVSKLETDQVTLNFVENAVVPSDENEEDEIGFSDSDASDDDDEVNELGNKYGIKRACPLNDLQSFHCVTSLPPDLLHDLLGTKK